jgi:hypothetical protein
MEDGVSQHAQGPDRVTEAEYVSATEGPNRDTESYYKATPAPGDYRDDRNAPPPMAASEDTDRLDLRPRKGQQNASPALGIGVPPAVADLPWMWIVMGIAAIGGMSLVGGGVLIYLWAGGESVPEDAPAEAEQEQQPDPDQEWEGLKVKKGLR